jgi:ubiquitin thioesterase protein OTUB1
VLLPSTWWRNGVVVEGEGTKPHSLTFTVTSPHLSQRDLTAMSTSAPDTRPLADLTDLEIATLTADLKTSQAALQPLISPLAPLASLASQYEGAPTYLSKIEQLRKDGWKETRGVRGDGNCFYRGGAPLSCLEPQLTRYE